MSFGVFALFACSPPSPTALPVDGSPADLEASTRELFTQYEAAIVAQRREAIAGFYHPDGAVRVIDGTTSRLSRAQLDSMYRGRWSPPAYFAWETLAYDSLDRRSVLVTGSFRWTPAGSSDTARYLYAAVVQAVDSGVAIRFEHETARPAP